MLIAQTSRGVARVVDDEYQLLDSDRTLGQLIQDGHLGVLHHASVRDTVSASEVTVLAPVSRPGKICIIGLNYLDHAEEIGAAAPTVPRFFWVAGSAASGPFDDIVLPACAPTEVDYEGEVALVIGAHAKSVDAQEAWRYVAGITVANDISARDVQLGRGGHDGRANVGVAKSFDTFKPLGPALLTADAIGPDDPLQITTIIDGETRQSSTTANLLFNFAELVARVSQYATLEPGDIVLTGTPAGVGMTTGRYLEPGQVVEVQLEHVGALRNTVVAS
ncbi:MULTISPECIES: fumarylacetoacetate hydrolase family protein [unclassified Mycobacterium]|uniref:fumarylacetoacetate hydrolase family protein n=1 Tax=unclassified Mycobacterium TaxID=2642494 RepID=UPI0029C7AAEC|nr:MULTISPECIES: fumarylacetoacetate hydrolase family protein [unclassified Mycobacterium]